MLNQVYDKDIEFRVHETLNGAWQPVQTTDIMQGLVIETPNWRMAAEIVDHGARLDFPAAFRQRWFCLGDRFECSDGVIAFSGDTVDCPGLRRLVLTHHRQKPDAMLEQMRRDVAADFAGEILIGHDGLGVRL